jgi:hypothetical protein
MGKNFQGYYFLSKVAGILINQIEKCTVKTLIDKKLSLPNLTFVIVCLVKTSTIKIQKLGIPMISNFFFAQGGLC